MSPPHPSHRARLLITCPDRTGVVAAVSQLLFALGANVVDSQQHTEPDDERFFMRLEFDLDGLDERLTQVRQAFQPVAERFAMEWRLSPAARQQRMALFVSKQDHCLMELLWQWRRGELPAEIPLVISNHPDAADWVRPFDARVPARPGDARTPSPRRRRGSSSCCADAPTSWCSRATCRSSPASFIEQVGVPVINIHHSFLPAFVGANPYAQAHQRGVKLIGATAHYVTAELDAGPIIEQDVQRVGHRQAVADLTRLGRQVERTVLARAVTWHVEDRVLVHGNKTVVFA